MTNILDTLISEKQNTTPSFTFNPEGKVKPLEYKGQLLPSKLFDSPVEYAKDLKQDVLNIGKAAKGQANDHELGRINDLAMKLGSLGLASYLFVKNPSKLSKAMEFVGFGTFFASMALWPKLAIQLPIKLRTGIDVNQKYIDSQGRKKKVSLDPQYVLTDLYSKEELNKIGSKMGVSENLPDRDNFIKQRMQKTSLQANTLGMITAGVAAPTMGALMCNTLEKPVNWMIEQGDLISSRAALKHVTAENAGQGMFARIGQAIRNRSLANFLKKNADKPLDDNMIQTISEKIAGRANAASIQDAVKSELAALKNRVVIDEAFVREALTGTAHEALLDSVSQDIYSSGSINSIANSIARSSSSGNKRQIAQNISGLLNQHKVLRQQPTVVEQSGVIENLAKNISEFAAGKKVVDKYIDARVGDKAGSFVANQWGRFCNKLFKSLKLSSKDLKAVAGGDMSSIYSRLDAISSNEAEYNKVMDQLMKLVSKYEQTAGSANEAKSKIQDMCADTGRKLGETPFSKLASRFSGGAVEQNIATNIDERVMGAQSSFYRFIQTLEIFKKSNTMVESETGERISQLTKRIKELLVERGLPADEASVSRITKACKETLMSASTTDYIEKLKSLGFELSEGEYKTVMGILCDGADSSASASGLSKYKSKFKDLIANWKNEMTPELGRCTLDGETRALNGVERNNIVGKPIKNMIQDAAKQTYNSKKWLKIFGGTMIVVAAVTLVAGLMFGRKSNVEKEAEEKNKVNG